MPFGGENRDFEPKGFDLCPPGGSLLEGEGNGNYRPGNATFPLSVREARGGFAAEGVD